jgi:hypothetical protein
MLQRAHPISPPGSMAELLPSPSWWPMAMAELLSSHRLISFHIIPERCMAAGLQHIIFKRERGLITWYSRGVSKIAATYHGRFAKLLVEINQDTITIQEHYIFLTGLYWSNETSRVPMYHQRLQPTIKENLYKLSINQDTITIHLKKIKSQFGSNNILLTRLLVQQSKTI